MSRREFFGAAGIVVGGCVVDILLACVMIAAAVWFFRIASALTSAHL